MRILIITKLKIFLFISILTLSLTKPVFSQTAAQNQETRISEGARTTEEEAVTDLKKTEEPLKKEADYTLTYGGWITSYFWHLDDLDNDKIEEDWISDMFLHDFRLWAKMELYQTFTTYARIRYYHVERDEAADYTSDKDGLYGPYLDMCYAIYDLKPKHNIPFNITAGRQQLKVGRGIAYSDVHDGVQIESVVNKLWLLKAFASRTKPHDRNIDYSVPDYKRQNDRRFWALEAAYTGIEKKVIYAYSLLQRDRTDKNTEDTAQDYDYDSEYYGIGVVGEPADNIKYWAEAIKEYGETHNDTSQTTNAKADVDAWAYNIGGKYRFNSRMHPVIEAETSFGSGDKDRQRVTNTTNGNISGDDDAFSYFGTFSAGYAFMPRLSNMFIHKAAFSLKPFEEHKKFKLNEIAVGGKYYFYHKHKSTGGIYDTDATVNQRFIGQEVDLYLYWKLRKDLYYSMRYGIFFPGSAYPNEANRRSEYLQIRMTYLF